MWYIKRSKQALVEGNQNETGKTNGLPNRPLSKSSYNLTFTLNFGRIWINLSLRADLLKLRAELLKLRADLSNLLGWVKGRIVGSKSGFI